MCTLHNNMSKKTGISLFLLILLITLAISVSAKIEDYDEIGGNFQDYNLGRDGTVGVWNEFLGTDFSTASVPMTSPRFIPLVADLNNDGINEIIVFDGNFIKVFRNTTLDPVDTFTLTVGDYGPFIVFDVDGDGSNEIIVPQLEDVDVSGFQSQMYFIGFNGTDLINESSYVIKGTAVAPDEEVIIACRGVQDCMYAAVNLATNFHRTQVQAFDTTNVSGNSLLISSNFLTTQTECFPIVPKLVVADYDGDGITEYVFVNGESSSGVDSVYIRVVDGRISIPPVLELEIEITDPVIDPGVSGNLCSDSVTSIGSRFTSPLVVDINGAPPLEFVVGFQVDDTRFKMQSFDSTGTEIDDYPEVFLADGVIVSNVILANVFPDTGDETNDNYKDFCVMGFNEPKQQLDLLCASEFNSQFFGLGNAEEFFFDGLTFNLTNLGQLSDSVFKPIVHAVQYNQITTEGSDLNEFVTPYGSFDVNEGLFGNSLGNLFNDVPVDGAIIPVDPGKVGFQDWLILTDNTLFYLDDNFANSQGQIVSLEINPCVDSVWKVNTSVQINVEVQDVDEDSVSSRAILYRGGSNEQDSLFTVNSSSGTTFTFSFVANETTTGSALRLFGRDVENADETADQIDFTFRVENNGVEFGDCKTTQEIELVGLGPGEVPIEDVPVGTTDPTDNVILRAFRTGNALFDDGLGDDIIWLAIMAIIAGAVWIGGSHLSPGITFGIVLVVEIILIVMGTLLGFLNIGILITIIVIGIIAVGLTFSKFFTGTMGNEGLP